jgi:mannose-1-phosphate guanylyltransferase
MRHAVGREDLVVGMFASDHMITNAGLFSRACIAAEKVASDHPGAIVQMGLRPTYPETGYGYIEMGDKASHDEGAELDVYYVAGFKEKPDEETARKYVASFRYLWNAGIFFFRIDTILSLYERLLPGLFTELSSIPFGTDDEASMLEKVYPTVQATSIDYGIIEKTKDIFVLPLDHLGWSDVGHFKSLWDVLPKDADGNVLEGSNVLTKDTKNTIVYGNGKLIACIGLENAVIVDTGDVLLVTTKEASQDIKKFLGSEGMKAHPELS